jgi:hypothetical protein
MTSTMKTINLWRKKLKKTTEDGKISNAHGSAELILWKCIYYQKQPICSMASLSKFQWRSSQRLTNKSLFIWYYKRLQVTTMKLSKRATLKYHNTWLQITLQSHSNKNSMVLAQKTDMKTNRTEYRTQIWIQAARPTWLLIFFFCSTGVWTQDLCIEPLHQPFFLCWVFLR